MATHYDLLSHMTLLRVVFTLYYGIGVYHGSIGRSIRYLGELANGSRSLSEIQLHIIFLLYNR